MRLDWLGSMALSWRDLLVIVNQLPRSSALWRAVNPDSVEWGLSEHLLASVIEAIWDGNWQRAGDPLARRPKRIPRPGVEPDEKKYGGKALPMDEMARQLGWEVTDG